MNKLFIIIIFTVFGASLTACGDPDKAPTEPKAVCNLLKKSFSDDSDDSKTSDQEYAQFAKWADTVEDEGLSRDLKALGTQLQNYKEGETQEGLVILSTYSSIQSDCARFDIDLPDAL